MNSFGNTSIGQHVNLLSNDVGKFDRISSFNLFYIIICPIQAIIMFILLWTKMGPGCLSGAIYIALLILLFSKASVLPYN